MKMKADPNYFRFPKPIEGTLIAFLMVVFYFALYQPGSVVLDWVGPVGTLARYLNKNHPTLLSYILYAAIAAHAGEAVYARSLCKKKGLNSTTTLKWVTQTFLMGFPSLLQLVAYKPNQGVKSS